MSPSLYAGCCDSELGEPRPNHRNPFSTALDAEPRPPPTPKFLIHWVGAGDRGQSPASKYFRSSLLTGLCTVRDCGLEQLLRLGFQSCSVTQYEPKCPEWPSTAVTTVRTSPHVHRCLGTYRDS